SLVALQPGEKVVTILPVRDLEEDNKYILFATQNGTVKKTPLKDFSNVMSRGIIAINIEKSDELITAKTTDAPQTISPPPRPKPATRRAPSAPPPWVNQTPPTR